MGVFRDALIDHCGVERDSLVLNEKRYEHEPGKGVSTRLGAYVRRWVRWVTAGGPASSAYHHRCD
jgi:hypothetical protein